MVLGILDISLQAGAFAEGVSEASEPVVGSFHALSSS